MTLILFAVNKYLAAPDVDIDDVVIGGHFINIEYASILQIMLPFFLWCRLHKDAIVVDASKFPNDQRPVAVVLKRHVVPLPLTVYAMSYYNREESFVKYKKSPTLVESRASACYTARTTSSYL